MNIKKAFLGAFTLTFLMFVITVGACKSTAASTTVTPKPGGGALVNSDSIVNAKIQSLSAQSSGYPWKLDMMLQSTQDVGTLINPVKDSVGKVITVFTDQDLKAFKVNDIVTAKIKYSGDVNTPGGVVLYTYNVALK